MLKHRYRYEALKTFVVNYFTKHQIPEEDARIIADVLLSADLRGVESHGIIRLNSYYGSRLRKGVIQPVATPTVIRETLTTLAVDGGNAMGQVVAYRTMVQCIEKAKETGLAAATVSGSNHYGIAGYYAMMALPHDMIGISFTNAQPLVAPTYGSKAMLGTNPIAVAIPSGEEWPYVLDMATSIVPIGRITVYQKAGKSIPEGWGIDKSGAVTTDPNEVLAGGALMALGGPDILRGYKGYGLALMVDILSGVLSGAAFGSNVATTANDRPSNVGHFFLALRVDAFRPIEDFKRDMDQLLRMMKDSPKAVGQERIYVAGEKEFERAVQFEREGIPLMPEVVRQLEQAAEEIGMTFDLEPVGTLEE